MIELNDSAPDSNQSTPRTNRDLPEGYISWNDFLRNFSIQRDSDIFLNDQTINAVLLTIFNFDLYSIDPAEREKFLDYSKKILKKNQVIRFLNDSNQIYNIKNYFDASLIDKKSLSFDLIEAIDSKKILKSLKSSDQLNVLPRTKISQTICDQLASKTRPVCLVQ